MVILKVRLKRESRLHPNSRVEWIYEKHECRVFVIILSLSCSLSSKQSRVTLLFGNKDGKVRRRTCKQLINTAIIMPDYDSAKESNNLWEIQTRCEHEQAFVWLSLTKEKVTVGNKQNKCNDHHDVDDFGLFNDHDDDEYNDITSVLQECSIVMRITGSRCVIFCWWWCVISSVSFSSHYNILSSFSILYLMSKKKKMKELQ